MFTLDGIFDIAYLAVSCALSAAFLAWAVVSACLVRRPRKGAGTAVLVVMAVLWSAVLLLALAAVLTHFGVFSAGDDGALTLSGVRVPYLGDVAERTDYPVSWALAGTTLACGIVGFVLSGVRGGKRGSPAATDNTPAASAGETVEMPAGAAAVSAERVPDVSGEPAGADERVPTGGSAVAADSAGEAGDEPAAAGERPGASDAGTRPAAAGERPGASDAGTRPAAFTAFAAADGGTSAGPAERAPDGTALRPEASGGADTTSGISVPDTGETIAVSARPVPPVTRKYVLLNRGNVAHMFNEYLSSLDEESKARLEQSLNTIIVKD